jgi:hypothetical protein
MQNFSVLFGKLAGRERMCHFMFKFERLRKERAPRPILQARVTAAVARQECASIRCNLVAYFVSLPSWHPLLYFALIKAAKHRTTPRRTADMSLLAPSPLTAFEQERLDRIAENRRRMGKLQFPCSMTT